MKYMKRAQIYKSANVTFNPKTKDAHSYGWWRFVGVVEGKTVASNFRYSNTTAKHQRKVNGLMNELGIKVDLTMPLPRGVRHDQTLAEMILEAEEHLCNEFLADVEKKQLRYQRSKARKLERKLESYLENDVAFRDYEIKPRSEFGKYNKIAVHQCVDAETLERDVENALYNFHRDGFSNIVFYVGGAQ